MINIKRYKSTSIFNTTRTYIIEAIAALIKK